MWFTLIILLSVYLLILKPIQYGMPWILHILLLVRYLRWVPQESKLFRSWSKWKWFHSQYKVCGPGKKHWLGNENSNNAVIYAIYPHGVYASPISLYVALNENLLHIKPVATSILFRIPILKEFAGLAGARPANRRDIEAALEHGCSVAIAPGGLRELQGLDQKRLEQDGGFVQREGFLKIAIAKQVPIVPIYVTNMDKLYSVWLPFPRLQRFLLSKILYPWPVFAWGNAKLPFWPKAIEQEIRIGREIYPTNDLQELKSNFYAHLRKLKK